MSEKARSELAVLVALAWADGSINDEEAGLLRRLAAELPLTEGERAEIETLLGEPVPIDRFLDLAHDLRRTHAVAGDRLLLLERAEALARADSHLDAREGRLLDVLRALLEAREEGSLFGRVRSLVGGLGRRASPPIDRGAPALTPEDRERLALGGLLARRLRPSWPPGVEPARSLAEAGLSPEEAEGILAGVRRNPPADFDRQKLCAEFNRRSGDGDRLRLLRALFALARSGGTLTREVETEIRLISNYLWIDPEEYHRVRLEMAGGRT